MKKLLKILLTVSFTALLFSCKETDPEEPVFPTPPPSPETEVSYEPAACSNRVVAHRCGAKEGGAPDNSLAALGYAMKLGCYAAEIDIYYTLDNQVIVHHGSSGKVNGMLPSQHTLEELRAAGRLANGEDIPTLEDFLDAVCVKGNCTRLWIETKNITNEELSAAEQETAIINGVRRSLEIIAAKKAEKFVEFNGTGRTAVFKQIYPMVKAKGYTMSMATGASAASMKSSGWEWSNYDVSAKSAGEIADIVADYQKYSVALSLYNIDSDALRKACEPHKDKVKGLMTNYPKAMLNSISW
ncbi:MAG: hypothetical protein IJP93_09855 [Bacteroidales bacterium]|nr:hypothetical protein [Bacteroidales bacterium]MBR0084375.1 hypothetical protein [Bacteroidales bacterium]